MGVAANIGQLAEKEGLSLREVSRRANLPYSTLYNAVKRDSKMNLSTIMQIADVLHCNYLDLCADELQMDSSQETCSTSNPADSNTSNSSTSSLNSEKIYYIDRTLKLYDALNTNGKQVAFQMELSLLARFLNLDERGEFNYLLRSFDVPTLVEFTRILDDFSSILAFQKIETESSD